MPASSSTVATQIALEPDIGGVSSGSMMMKPICARGSFGGTSRLTWRKTPPRGSLSTKLRNAPSLAMKRDCSHKVSPGGGATPPTITSPTSPSAWQETTWMILEDAHDEGFRCRPVVGSSRVHFQAYQGGDPAKPASIQSILSADDLSRGSLTNALE